MSKPLKIRLFGLLIAAAGTWVALTQPPPPAELTVEKIADDLHVIFGDGGNVAVYTTPEGVILVDDKFERNHQGIVAKVKAITGQPIRYVLNTHQHGDHTGGNQKLLEMNAEIILHRNARANMVKGNQPGPGRLAFADEMQVVLGGKEVRARHFGTGHTNGDALILFPERRVLHAGDLFTAGAPFIDYNGGGSAVAWTATLTRALTMGFDTVIPGHGPIMKRADLEAHIRKIEALRSKVLDLKRQGKSKEEVAQTLNLEDLGWKASPLFGRSIPGLYDEVR